MIADIARERAKLKRMLVITMILMGLVPLALVLGLGYHAFTASVERQTTETMRRLITDHGRMIERFLSERRKDLELLLDTRTFDELVEPGRLEQVQTILRRRSPAFYDLGICDERGLHVAYAGPLQLAGSLAQDAPWFTGAMDHGSFVSDVSPGYRQTPHFIIAIAHGERGHRWVMRAGIDGAFFGDLVSNAGLGWTGEAYIMNAGGILQTEGRSGGHLLEPSPDQALLPSMARAAFPASSDGGPADSSRTASLPPPGEPMAAHFLANDESGRRYLYFTLDLQDGQWRLVARREAADAFAEIRTVRYLVLVTLGVVGVWLGVMAFFLTRTILRRMEGSDQARQQLEDQLVRATRLAELGQMAAGVVHEINNLLQIIKSEQTLIDMNLQDLKGEGALPPSEPLTDLENGLQQIQKQVSRCASITQSVLKFGRKSTPQIEPVMLQEFVLEVLQMVAKEAQVQGIQVSRTIAADLPPVRADASQLQQVLLNLFNNAMDAMVERHGVKGGHLEVSVREGESGQVTIAVTDNGVGISPENLTKVFTSFFSTKPVGKGTGLGLAVCHGIIDKLGGTMEVSSCRNEGTTFSIHLPRAKAKGAG